VLPPENPDARRLRRLAAAAAATGAAADGYLFLIDKNRQPYVVRAPGVGFRNERPWHYGYLRMMAFWEFSSYAIPLTGGRSGLWLSAPTPADVDALFVAEWAATRPDSRAAYWAAARKQST
jgi:hypothetical protein